MSSLPVSSLRAHLLSSLTSLPGSRIFHIHVLVSSSRRPTQSLFPYASPRPKYLLQDVLVLLSEEVASAGAEYDLSSSKGDPATCLKPRTFVSAIEACVYAFPTSDSTILYISKVDGTGQGVFPSPTSTLLRALVMFYASPGSPVYTTRTTHHLWIHLFARSQRQYLFPNSADYPNKKPLGDVALCKWWKSNLSDVAKAVEDTNVPMVGVPAAVQSRLYYLLPGQSEQEASYLLREAQYSPVRWIYSHPYDNHAGTELPYPSDPHDKFSSEGHGPRPLASLIPRFEDDPKSRFLDELAATSEEHTIAVPIPTPKRKRQKIGEGSERDNSTLTDNHLAIECHTEDVGDPSTRLPPPPEIVYNPPSSSPLAGGHSPPSRPSTPEPIKSNRFPQLSPHTPDLPTFPSSLLSPHTPTSYPLRTATTLQAQTTPASPRTPRTPRTPRRPISDLDTISLSEFWERMSYRQECAQGAVTGFFVAVFSQRCDTTTRDEEPDDVVSHLPPNSKTRSISLDPSAPAHIDTPLLLGGGTVPHSVIKRVMSSLLTGVEFSTVERAHKGTQVIESAIEGLCEGLGHVFSELSTKERRNDLKIPTKDTTYPDIYKEHVYASLAISNSPLDRKSADNPGTVGSRSNAPVNILGARRKKKRE